MSQHQLWHRSIDWIISITILVFAVHQSLSFTEIKCDGRKGLPLPAFPKKYITDLKINVETSGYTVEVLYATNDEEKKQMIEFQKKNRRVRYIIRGDQKSVLLITYKKDEHPTCVVKKVLETDDFLESEDAGPSRIISDAFRTMIKPSEFDDYGLDVENGMYVKKWTGCFKDPKINVAITFADQSWSQPFTSSLLQEIFYPEKIEAQIPGSDIAFTAFYSNFIPQAPDDALFQPPEDVYCDDFRTDKKPPSIADYFSYNAEILVYESAAGIAPIVSFRKVFYDYKDKITRMDFYDPLVETPDIFSPITAEEKSLIHDFNAGIQYFIDPLTGKCTQDSFQSTFSVLLVKQTEGNDMLKGNEFFLLSNAKLSYNGQFPVRGMMADVYTSIQTYPQKKEKFVVSWYFSTEETRIVETDSAEKNILLRMKIRPETGLDKEGVVILNFYNFAQEQPSSFTYDLRSCFNDSFSKVLVLTFPANDLLKGSEKLIGMLVHDKIRDITGISKQRIYINEVTFAGKYMYAEFDILESPVPLSKTEKPEHIGLDKALNNLKDAVSSDKFVVNVPVGDTTVMLKPEPNGLNVFAGDRTKAPSIIGYKEGSVIALTIGMLLLGFLLGAVVLNLVMSKKFGVSLFQKSNKGNDYDRSLDESSM